MVRVHSRSEVSLVLLVIHVILVYEWGHIYVILRLEHVIHLLSRLLQPFPNLIQRARFNLPFADSSWTLIIPCIYILLHIIRWFHISCCHLMHPRWSRRTHFMFNICCFLLHIESIESLKAPEYQVVSFGMEALCRGAAMAWMGTQPFGGVIPGLAVLNGGTAKHISGVFFIQLIHKLRWTELTCYPRRHWRLQPVQVNGQCFFAFSIVVAAVTAHDHNFFILLPDLLSNHFHHALIQSLVFPFQSFYSGYPWIHLSRYLHSYHIIYVLFHIWNVLIVWHWLLQYRLIGLHRQIRGGLLW